MYNKAIQNIVFSLLMLVSYGVCGEKTKQALRAIDKGEFAKATEIVNKSLRKDSLNPASNYVMAVLFSIDSLPQFDIDLAHRHIVLSEKILNLATEDYLKEFEKANLDIAIVGQRKKYIDSLAFEGTQKTGTIERYNFFIDQYIGASQVALAVASRDQLVYQNVESVNTWQAFGQFAKEYPEAAQVNTAIDNYERLLYADKTASGELNDLISFLDSNPNTPYREQLEGDILNQSITYFEKGKITWFLSNYHNERLTTKALSLLYHADFMGSVDPKIIENHQEFFDSARHVSGFNKIPIFPIWNGTYYSFLKLNGESLIDMDIAHIDPRYFCGNILDDILKVEYDGQIQLINRVGATVFAEDIEAVDDLGSGLLAIVQNGKMGAIHQSGLRLVPSEYEAITLLDDRILAVKKNGLIGLMGINGEWIVKPKFNTLTAEGNYWIYQIGEWFGVTDMPSVIDGQVNFVAKYEEIELIDEHYLIAYNGDFEVLINKDLQEVIPGGSKRINTRFETWVMESEEGYKIFDKQKNELSKTTYSGLLQNREWLCLKGRSKWSVYNKDIYDEPIIGIDSVKLIGQDLVMLFRGNRGMAIFPNKQVVEFEEGEKLKSIGSTAGSATHFLVIGRGNQNTLYKDGVKLFETKHEEIGYLSDSAFFVKKGGKYGAIGLDGRLIMRIRYDAITEAENEIAPVLYRGKFGAYNFSDGILLNLNYDAKIITYNHQYLKIRSENKFGFLDRFNEEIIKPTYNEIKYWTDTSAMVLDNDAWQIINIESGEVYLSDVLDFEYVKNTQNEKIIRVRTALGYGIYHSQKGFIIPPTFNDILNLGNEETPFYFAEKSIAEAGYYVVVYYDANGTKIKSSAYSEVQYEQIVCDN